MPDQPHPDAILTQHLQVIDARTNRPISDATVRYVSAFTGPEHYGAWVGVTDDTGHVAIPHRRYRERAWLSVHVEGYEAVVAYELPLLEQESVFAVRLTSTTPVITRAHILANLRANISLSELDAPWLLLRYITRAGRLMADMIGSWRYLFLSDDDFARTMHIHRRDGELLVFTNLRINGYQPTSPTDLTEFSGDLTIDIPLARQRLQRVFDHGGVPVVCLDVADRDGGGRESIDTWTRILPQLADLMPIVFTAWELKVDGGPSQFSAKEHDEVIALYRSHRPDGIVCVEFATDAERDDCISYDGRAVDESIDDKAAWYWQHGPGRQIDVLLIEAPGKLVYDLPALVNSVGGVVCRVQGRWPNSNPNWQGDYGTGKPCVLFEYGSYYGLTAEESRMVRTAVQAKVPIAGYGEG